MRLLELELEGFGSYLDRCSLDLSRVDAAVVTGRNGAGKSTLFDAQLWCLFGETPVGRSVDSLIHSRSDQVQVSMRFVDTEDIEWRVSRFLSRSNHRKFLAEDSTGRTATSAKGVTAAMIDVLGAEAKVLCVTAFARQGEAGLFTSGSAGQRRAILARVFQHLQFKAMAEVAGRDRTAKAGKANTTQYEADRQAEIAETCEQRRKHVQARETAALAAEKHLAKLRELARPEDESAAVAVREAQKATTRLQETDKAMLALTADLERVDVKGRGLAAATEGLREASTDAAESAETAQHNAQQAAEAAAGAAAVAEPAPERLRLLADGDTAECPLCGADLDDGHAVQLRADLGALIEARNATADTAAAARRQAAECSSRARQTRSALDQNESDLKKARSERENSKQRLTSLRDQAESFRPVAERLAELQEIADSSSGGPSQQRIEAAAEQYRQAQIAVGEARQSLAEAETARAALPDLRDAAQGAATDAERSRLLANAMQPSGIQQIATQRVTAQIGRASNLILADMSDLRVRFSESAESGEDMAIEAKYQGAEWRSYPTFSGGEKIRVDVAIRVGLAEMLKVKCRQFLIDEGLGALDPPGERALGQMLHKLVTSGRYDQVFAITHMENTAATFAQRIEVSKDGDSSTARVICD